MPKAPKEFIKQEDTRLKLEWQIKENTVLNKVYKFLTGANIDKSLQNLIYLNYNFYRLMYSLSLCLKIIYMNTKDVQIQECYVEGYSKSQTVAQRGWIVQTMKNNYVLQYPPVLLNAVVEQKQMNLEALLEN